MHNIKSILILFLIFPFFIPSGLIAQETGSFRDARNGKVYKTVKIGNQWVMAENFAYKSMDGGCFVYGNDTVNLVRYGYLYDWQTAINNAPKGWHLPSLEEWKKFRKSMGAGMDTWWTMKKVYKNMVPGGSSGFNAQFGGVYITAYGAYRSIGEVGYYWSSTLSKEGQPANYILEKKSGEAYISGYGNPMSGMSVRYFKD